MVKNKFFLIFFSIFYLLPNFTFAVVFEVTDYVGETWFANPNEIIGKKAQKDLIPGKPLNKSDYKWS